MNLDRTTKTTTTKNKSQNEMTDFYLKSRVRIYLKRKKIFSFFFSDRRTLH